MLHFKCASCGAEGVGQIEAVMVDCTMSVGIAYDPEIEEDPDELETGDVLEICDGYIDRFQCRVCGHVILKDRDTDDLLALLKGSGTENKPE